MKLNKTILVILLPFAIFSQEKVAFKGQLSGITSFSPDNDLDWFAGARYLPELSYKIPLDTMQFVDFNAAANIWGTTNFHPFNAFDTQGDIEPYRLWARYSRNQLELRLGLQKIDFGSATMLRPVQWFNQIDPRDPLQLTNGVYGALARYYFLNNANIWVWGLIGNEKTRGYDVVETNKKIPEFGGRIQYPVPKGEIAFSYHHRTANSTNLVGVPQYEEVEENKFGIDGKWDVTVGLWFEAAHSQKTKNIGQLTNQTLLSMGSDYTFGIGNGLNIAGEHLISSFDEKDFGFNNTSNISALTASYPLNIFDNLSTILYYDWESENMTFFVNYEHQFKKLTGYLMLLYNPETQQAIQENDLVSNFSGPGIRFMLVYNH
ncbi:hypothetical protein EV196_10650 [Mariniflexile fucanivorans]|uniref:Uncharacterized protein n=1 Tax=Mariniflexile fucanivorans TaxID=264023 RepID=A0A4R1RGX9_9FLAO|nr:hypothetical protein [Mariniflexile fucanivorans]TCL64862.1 hypothetical protein EV196_10650 [Mariniflexile fucanivorans]